MGTELQSSTEENDSCKFPFRAALKQLRLWKLQTSFLFHVFSKGTYTFAHFVSTRSSHSEFYDLLILICGVLWITKADPQITAEGK